MRWLYQTHLASDPRPQRLRWAVAFDEILARPAIDVEQSQYRAAAEAMRRILIDHARGRARGKRGGGRVRVDLEDANLATWRDPDDVLALDEALHRLMEQDPRAAEIVQLRFFAGLSVEETAKALELSIRTVHREWKFARTWLFRALGEADD